MHVVCLALKLGSIRTLNSFYSNLLKLPNKVQECRKTLPLNFFLIFKLKAFTFFFGTKQLSQTTWLRFLFTKQSTKKDAFKKHHTPERTPNKMPSSDAKK